MNEAAVTVSGCCSVHALYMPHQRALQAYRDTTAAWSVHFCRLTMPGAIGTHCSVQYEAGDYAAIPGMRCFVASVVDCP